VAFTTRLATPDDYPIFARLFPELAVHDPLPAPEHFAQRMLPRVLLLLDGETALGYAYWQRYDRTAHVVNVVIDPTARQRGAGLALMEALRAHVIEQGCERWYLNVKTDNTPALRLYNRCGLMLDHSIWALRLSWVQVDRLPGVSDGPVDAFVTTTADDEALMVSFGLERDRIALWRARPTTHLVALRRGGTLVGFTAFDPTFPGAHPFRVATLDLAHALLDACRAAIPLGGYDYLHVTVEKNMELRELLVAAGATVSFALVQLSAALS
jgi:GNAT superfamily N-acetyltransferase